MINDIHFIMKNSLCIENFGKASYFTLRIYELIKDRIKENSE